MTEQPKRGGWGLLIAAKAVCCGILLLFLSGAVTLSDIAGWLRDGNLAWLGLSVAVATVVAYLWRRLRGRPSVSSERIRQLETKGTS